MWLGWGSWESESCSVVSDSLRPHGLYSPWNSPGQNTGVGNLSLFQGIFPTQGLNTGLLHCRWILYQLSHRGSPGAPGTCSKKLDRCKCWLEGELSPSPASSCPSFSSISITSTEPILGFSVLQSRARSVHYIIASPQWTLKVCSTSNPHFNSEGRAGPPSLSDSMSMFSPSLHTR